MDPLVARQIAEKFVRFLETNEDPPGLFAADCFCDFTSPRWREQVQGGRAVADARRAKHPVAGKVPRWSFAPTPTGLVIELEETWRENGDDWYCREMFRLEVTDGAIAELSIYCTGDWNTARRAEHARMVKLLRP